MDLPSQLPILKKHYNFKLHFKLQFIRVKFKLGHPSNIYDINQLKDLANLNILVI